MLLFVVVVVLLLVTHYSGVVTRVPGVQRSMAMFLFLLIALTGIAVASSTTLFIPVNSGQDGVSNISACIIVQTNPTATDECTLRSALAYCSSHMQKTEDLCSVNITVPDVTINPDAGEMVYTGNGTLKIDGHGSSITGSGIARLLNITMASSADLGVVSFSLSHVQCLGFGSESSGVGGGEQGKLRVIH
jgi:hypothetical protein